MHQINLIRNQIAATTRPLAAPPTTSREPRWIRVGRGTYPFSTYAAASAAYCATIARLRLGMSEAPACEVLDEAGNLVARVAYNGRVFAVSADGESDVASFCTRLVAPELGAGAGYVGPAFRLIATTPRRAPHAAEAVHRALVPQRFRLHPTWRDCAAWLRQCADWSKLPSAAGRTDRRGTLPNELTSARRHKLQD